MSSTRNTVGLSVNQKKWIYIAISFAAMMIIKNVTFPSSITTINGAELTATGQEALSVLVLALLLWITEAIPFHFTGILAMALLSVFGVNSFANIVKVGFGNINVIFFIGVFILSAFINKSGLGKRLVNICLSITGNSTKFILLGSTPSSSRSDFASGINIAATAILEIHMERITPVTIKPSKINFVLLPVIERQILTLSSLLVYLF